MMLTTSHLRVWVYPAPCDLRNGFNGLSAMVTHQLCRDVMGGDLFLFVNRRRTLCKMLFWDGSGLCILHKRLYEQKFPRLWKRDKNAASGIELTPNELGLFLEGCEVLEERRLSRGDAAERTLAPPIEL